MNKEQANEYLAALEREREGYEARLEGAKILGGEDGEAEQSHMVSRISQVDAEIKRVKKDVLGKAKPAKEEPVEA